jgi:hypothetical protein
MHLVGVYLIGVYGPASQGLHLIGMRLMGMHLVGLHLMGMGVGLTSMYNKYKYLLHWQPRRPLDGKAPHPGA